MKNTLVDRKLLPRHPWARHPHTGEAIEAIGIVHKRGGGSQAIFPMMGASEDDGAEGEESDEETEETESEGSEKGEEGKAKKKAGDEEETVSKAEFDKLKKRMQAADQNRAKAQEELDKILNKDKPELERITGEYEKLKGEHEKLQGSFRKQALTNAFLMASGKAKILWHNPDTAFRAANFSDLEIDDEGNVDGIEAAVKQHAKENPFLVNKGKTSDADEEEEVEEKNGASGSAVGSGKKTKTKAKKGEISKEDLYRRFPALRK